MATAKPKAARRRVATTPQGEPAQSPRTIEDIERRQREVRVIETDALGVLVWMLRDVAIALPVESKLVFALADCAKEIERRIPSLVSSEYGKPAIIAGNALYDLRREIAEEIGRWTPDEEEDR